MLHEFSRAGGSREVLPTITNYTNFFEKDKNYVKLDFDLNAILSPSRYRAFFMPILSIINKDTAIY
jgi:hypothetical protein